MPRISCVIFDAGGVLYTLDTDSTWDAFTSLCGRGREEVRAALYADDCFNPFERGEISALDYFNAVRGKLSCDLDYGEFCSIWNSNIAKRDDMFGLAQTLKGSMEVAVLSNTNELNAAVIEKDLAGLADPLIFSFRVGLMKPDPEIYALALRLVGAPPERVLFVDDLAENVEGARRAGLPAVLFTGIEDFVETLERSGVPVAGK